MERIVQIYGLSKTWQNTTTSESHPLRFVHNHRFENTNIKQGSDREGNWTRSDGFQQIGILTNSKHTLSETHCHTMENVLRSRCFLEMKGVCDVLAIYKKNLPSTPRNHILSPDALHFTTNTHTKTNTTTTLHDIFSITYAKERQNQFTRDNENAKGEIQFCSKSSQDYRWSSWQETGPFTGKGVKQSSDSSRQAYGR